MLQVQLTKSRLTQSELKGLTQSELEGALHFD